MKIKEFLDGSGVYTAPASQISAKTWFIRDPKRHADGVVSPLLHICERELDPDVAVPTYVLTTAVVRWDFFHGRYWCKGCKKEWNKEVGLRAIWSDGLGTGDEGHC